MDSLLRQRRKESNLILQRVSGIAVICYGTSMKCIGILLWLKSYQSERETGMLWAQESTLVVIVKNNQSGWWNYNACNGDFNIHISWEDGWCCFLILTVWGLYTAPSIRSKCLGKYTRYTFFLLCTYNIESVHFTPIWQRGFDIFHLNY